MVEKDCKDGRHNTNIYNDFVKAFEKEYFKEDERPLCMTRCVVLLLRNCCMVKDESLMGEDKVLKTTAIRTACSYNVEARIQGKFKVRLWWELNGAV